MKANLIPPSEHVTITRYDAYAFVGLIEGIISSPEVTRLLKIKGVDNLLDIRDDILYQLEGGK